MRQFLSFIGASLATGTLAASVHAGVIGLVADNYEVVDGSRRYSVLDVFVACSGTYDKLVNYYGTASSTSLVRTGLNGVQNGGASWTATNGVGFAQASGSGWMPSVGAAGTSWDSFVTIGARSQGAASSVVTGDNYFLNVNVAGAETIAGGSTLQGAYAGAGWYTTAPTGNHVYAGSYGDMRLMLGRFAVDVTELSATDVLTLQFKGNVTMKVGGTSAGGGTTVQPSFDETFAYGFVPAPGALGVLTLAGVWSRRRR